MKKNRRGKTRRGVRGGGMGGPGSSNRGGRGGGNRNPSSPSRASPSVVGGAQGVSPSPAGGIGSYSQIARRGTGGDGGGAVTTRSTCASYMADHGAMRFNDLSTRGKLSGKPKDVTAGDVVAWGASKPAVAAKVKDDEEVDAAEPATADSPPAKNAKTAAAAVVAKTKAAIGAGSTAAGDAAAAAKAKVEAVGADRSTTVEPSPTAAGGVSGAAVAVAAAPAGVETPSGKAPAAALETAVVATAVAVGKGPTASADLCSVAESEGDTAGDDAEAETEGPAVDPAYELSYAIVSSKKHTRGNSSSPARASMPAVGSAQGGSPVTAGGTYSQVARCRTGGDGREAVAIRSTCASYMAGHGVMRLQELSTGGGGGGKQNDASAGDVTTPAWGKTAAQAKAKAAVAVDTAESAAVDRVLATNDKTATAAVVATTFAAIDASSTTSGDAAPEAEATIQAVDAVRSTTVEPAPTAAGGMSEVAVVPMAAARAVVETLLGQAPAMDVAPAATGVTVPVAAGATADKDDQALTIGLASKEKTAVAAATATANVVAQSGPGSAADVHPAAADANPESKTEASAVGTVDHKGQPADAGVVAVEAQGVPAMVEAEAEAAVYADDVSAAADNFAAASGGGALQAEAAVVAAEMVAVSVAVAIDAVSAANVEGAPTTEVRVEAIDVGRPIDVGTSPASTGGLARASAVPVAAALAAVVSNSGRDAAMDVAPAATGVMLVLAASAPADRTNQAAAIDVAIVENEKAAMAATIVSVHADQGSAASVGPVAAGVDPRGQGETVAVGTADDQGQSAVAGVVATSEHGVPATVEALREAAVDAGEMPAAAENATVAGRGDAAAAVVVSEMAVVAAAVVVDVHQGPAEGMVPGMDPGVPEAGESQEQGVPATVEALREAAVDAGEMPAAAENAAVAGGRDAAAAVVLDMAVVAAAVAVDEHQGPAEGMVPEIDPGVPEAAEAEEHGVPAMVEALREAAVDVGGMPAAAENAVVAGGDGAAAAVVVLDMAVVAAAVEVDEPQDPAGGMISEMDPGGPEAAEAEEQGVPAMVEALREAAVDVGGMAAAAENAVMAGGVDAAAAVVVLDMAVVAAAVAVDEPQGPAEGIVAEMGPGVPEAAEVEEQGVPVMMEALAEVAVEAGEMPAAVENAVVAGGDDAAAAVVVLDMAVGAAAVAIDVHQGPAEDDVPEMNPVAPEAAEAAGAVAEPVPLAAAAGGRTRQKFSTFHILLYGIWCLFWVLVMVANLGPIDSISRGHSLSPNDKPLAPGEHIEGKGGLHRLGWLFPWFGYTPKLAVSAGGGMIATRPDGSEVVLAGGVPEQKANRGFLCGVERLVRRVARLDAPKFGGRSVKGRLVLGQEYLCAVDASAAATSTMNLAQQWLEGSGDGEGVIGFSDDGDLEMLTPSGELVWSLAEGQGDDGKKEAAMLKKEERQRLVQKKKDDRLKEAENRKNDKLKKEAAMLKKEERQRLVQKKKDDRLKEAENRKNDKLERAAAYKRRLAERKAERKAAKLRKKEESSRLKAERAEAQQKKKEESERRRQEKNEAKKTEKGRRKSLFGWNDGAAGDAAKDSSSSPAQREPPKRSIFGRSVRSVQPTPNGAGGQAR